MKSKFNLFCFGFLTTLFLVLFVPQTAKAQYECVPDGSCSAPDPACGETTSGTDNCGNGCSKTGDPCPPPPSCDYNHSYNECCSQGYSRSVTEYTWSDGSGACYYDVGDCNQRDGACGCIPDESWQYQGYRECCGNQTCAVYRNTCTGDWQQRDPQYQDGACGYCTPDKAVGTVRDGSTCNGEQQCTVNVQTRSDCTKYYGGFYDCQYEIGKCGYNGAWNAQCLDPYTVQISGDNAYSYGKDAKGRFAWQQNVPMTHSVPRGSINWWASDIQQSAFSCRPLGVCSPKLCTTNRICYGSCNTTAAYNTCGNFNGTQNNCVFTGPQPCQSASTDDQSCAQTVNNCDASKGYSCSNSTCVTTVKGKVFIDSDNNGVYSSGETIYSGATLTLYNSSGQQLQTTTSSSSGYGFSGIADGTYRVVLTAVSGYQATSSTSKTVTISTSIPNSSVDFGLTSLCSYLQTIGGDVYSGRGINASCAQ